MILRFLKRIRRLKRNNRAVAAVEFALIAPVFLLVLVGAFDLTMLLYAQNVLQGAVSDAARSSSLEGFVDDQTQLDNRVKSNVQNLLKDATFEFERQAYLTFDDVGLPEHIVNDANENGLADPGECFLDANGSKQWEADRGRAGNGGADDVVRYKVTVRFDRLFPLWALMGQPQETALSATTVLRNQPYGTREISEQQICIPLP